MASSSFNFDDLDPMVAPSLLSRVARSSLPSGELNFEEFVEVSPAHGNTGGRRSGYDGI
jgi:hypothetical protein